MAGWMSEVLVSILRRVRFPHKKRHISWNPTTGSASGGNVRQRQQYGFCLVVISTVAQTRQKSYEVVSPSTGSNSPQQEAG